MAESTCPQPWGRSFPVSSSVGAFTASAHVTQHPSYRALWGFLLLALASSMPAWSAPLVVRAVGASLLWLRPLLRKRKSEIPAWLPSAAGQAAA